jgi:hypothetical protein
MHKCQPGVFLDANGRRRAMAGGMGVALDAIERLSRERELFRARDVEALGVSRSWLQIMLLLGMLQEVGPAIFTRSRLGAPAIAIAQAAIPSGVACLTTALQLHGWDDVDAPEIWWAIPRSVRKPKRAPVPMRFLRVSPGIFERDVELHSIYGFEVRAYSLPRTIADCLRFRRRLGASRAAPWWRRLLAEAERLAETPSFRDRASSSEPTGETPVHEVTGPVADPEHWVRGSSARLEGRRSRRRA